MFSYLCVITMMLALTSSFIGYNTEVTKNTADERTVVDETIFPNEPHTDLKENNFCSTFGGEEYREIDLNDKKTKQNVFSIDTEIIGGTEGTVIDLGDVASNGYVGVFHSQSLFALTAEELIEEALRVEHLLEEHYKNTSK